MRLGVAFLIANMIRKLDLQATLKRRFDQRRHGLTLAEAADALDCSLLKISRIERGHVNDSKFLTKYRTWLKQQTPAQIAA